MNKFAPALALVGIFGLQACNQQASQPAEEAKPAEAALDTHEQRLSYGIAQGFGQQMQANQLPLDGEAFTAGLMDVLEGRESRLTQEEIAAEMQTFQSSMQEKQGAERAEQGLANSTAGMKFLVENGTREGVMVTDSGLQYEIVEEGSGAVPGPNDTVEVHYRGTLIDGTEFDSSYKRGETVSFGVGQVIPGWTEALQMMPAGSKWKLFIPPELAYGPGGAGAVIGPNATLVFDVELVSVTAAEAAAQ